MTLLSFKQFVATLLILQSGNSTTAFSLASLSSLSVSSSTRTTSINNHVNRAKIFPIVHSPSLLSSSTRVYMKSNDDGATFKLEKNKKKDDSSYGLKAASVSYPTKTKTRRTSQPSAKEQQFAQAIQSLAETVKDLSPVGLGKVLAAAMLITSNTVGASMMVLPGLASGPGLVVSTGLLSGVYLVHLFSGLLLAEVAINQYETSACDVPSSFKEFADVNFNSESAGTLIAITSVFVNMCVLSFDLVRGGEAIVDNQQLSAILAPLFANDMLNTPMAAHCASIFAALGLTAAVGTQSSETLSKLASICCITLFVSFAGLVLPGLASIHDPVATFMTPGTTPIGSDDFSASLSTFAPIALMALVYQNIVPTITKVLNYDRKQVVPAIMLGSFIPMLMYVSYCFVEIGTDGVASTLSAGGTFMSGIRISALVGSAMACTISISQELDIFFGNKKSEDDNLLSSDYDNNNAELLDVNSEKSCLIGGDKPTTFDMPLVALSIVPPLLAGIYFSGGEGFVGALSLSGSYGTPILYGIVPVLLALNQRNNNNVDSNDAAPKQIVPGGWLSLGAFATASIALIGSHLISDVSSIL